MCFKHKPGFSLIEVLCALAIFMMVMVPLLDLSGMLVLQASTKARAMQRLLLAESFMLENRILQRYGKKPLANKKIADPACELSYQRKPVSEALKSFKNVETEVVTIQWTEKGRKRNERLVSFVPAEPKEKS